VLTDCVLSRVLGAKWHREAQLAEVLKRGSVIKRGTTRSEVERIFPNLDGGLQSVHSTRYYVPPGILVVVSYALKGGQPRPTDPVKGPIMVSFGPASTD
jgi:hypothetical protein